MYYMLFIFKIGSIIFIKIFMEVILVQEQKKEIIRNFSIIVTERCNSNCTYCHFYTKVDRASRKDMDKVLFEKYMEFIKFFIDKDEGEVTYRFSGGDPIVLGDKLFELGNRAFEITGIKPYFLTAGRGIDEKWIEKAKKSAYSHAFVSLENPLNSDPGAVNAYETLKKVSKFSSDDFKLEFGSTVIRNEDFKDLFKICKIVYEETGKLPKLHEINYLPYTSPTEQEIEDLYNNLVMVIREYHKKVPLDFFPYISPEFCSSHDNKIAYLAELNMKNSYNIGKVSFEDASQKLIDNQSLNYPKSECKDISCDWYNQCKRIKWLWKYKSYTVTAEKKFEDYCKFKKAINNAFYDALV